MSPVEYLDLDDVLSLALQLGVGPVRDIGLLDSATARPKSSAFGRDAYPTLALKAAALLDSMAKNRALADGNKRLAWLSVVVFLDLNGRAPALSDDDAFDLVSAVAGAAVDLVEIAQRLLLDP